MANTVIRKRFQSLLIASVILSGVDYFAGMVECIIAGDRLGGGAVAAITLLSPMMPLLTFIGMLIISGSMTLFFYAEGKADKDEINRIYGQAVILCVIVGTLISFALFAGKGVILSYWDVSAEVAAYASDYYDGLAWRPAIYFVSQILLSLLLAEGELKRSIVAAVIQFTVTVFGAYLLCREYGAIGLSLGTTFGFLADCFAKGSFLLTEKCPITLCFYLNAKKILTVLHTSFGMALADLWLAIFPFAMTSYLLVNFGENTLIVFGVINSILCVAFAVFQGVEQAMQPMVCVYNSEENLRGLQKIMKLSFGATAGIGILLSVAFLSLSDILPGMFGAEDPVTKEMAKAAMFAFLPFITFRALGMTYSAYYAFTDRETPAAVFQALMHCFLPVAFAIVGGNIFGLTGVWIGLGISGAVVLLAEFLYSRIETGKHKNLGGILLLDKQTLSHQISYDCMSVQDEVMELSYRVADNLLDFGINPDKCRMTQFFTEEIGMDAVERSKGKPFEIELTLTVDGDTVTFIMRDNGVLKQSDNTADITNPDNMLSSFRMYIVSQLATKLDYRSYIRLGGENRTALKF